MDASALAPAVTAPGEVLRRYIARDRDEVLSLTAKMPAETQAKYLAIHDEALAAVDALDRPRPEFASAAVLAEYLLENGAAWARPPFLNETRPPQEIWETTGDLPAMLALLEVLRPVGYAGLIRSYMVEAIELVRALDLPAGAALEFTRGANEMLALAAARARGEIALADLPKAKAVRRRIEDEQCQNDKAVQSALTLVLAACAENVAWAVKEFSARITDHGYMAAYAASFAAYSDSFAEMLAREKAEQGRTAMRVRLAETLRERFPNPFV